MKHFDLPLSEQDLALLRAGDCVTLSGPIYTAARSARRVDLLCGSLPRPRRKSVRKLRTDHLRPHELVCAPPVRRRDRRNDRKRRNERRNTAGNYTQRKNLICRDRRSGRNVRQRDYKERVCSLPRFVERSGLPHASKRFSRSRCIRSIRRFGLSRLAISSAAKTNRQKTYRTKRRNYLRRTARPPLHTKIKSCEK